MKLLLDTHAVVWAMLSPARLSSKARALISDEGNTIFVSAASAWEISTKVRLGKFPDAENLERDFQDLIEEAGYTALPITVADGLRAGRFVAEHGDPFDRMIAAQALALDIPIVSVDSQLDVFGMERIW